MDFIKENYYEIINPLFIAKEYIDCLKNAGILNDEQKKEIEMIDKNLSKIGARKQLLWLSSLHWKKPIVIYTELSI